MEISVRRVFAYNMVNIVVKEDFCSGIMLSTRYFIYDIRRAQIRVHRGYSIFLIELLIKRKSHPHNKSVRVEKSVHSYASVCILLMYSLYTCQWRHSRINIFLYDWFGSAQVLLFQIWFRSYIEYSLCERFFDGICLWCYGLNLY